MSWLQENAKRRHKKVPNIMILPSGGTDKTSEIQNTKPPIYKTTPTGTTMKILVMLKLVFPPS
jgi:hypothetical protein